MFLLCLDSLDKIRSIKCGLILRPF